ncbi:MAG: cytochrome P450 [Acidimicrobiales bacterium]
MINSPEDINFFNPDINDCPYDAYSVLRDQAPVWQDPITGMFIMTRHEDIKQVLADTEVFTNAVGSAAGMTEKAIKPTDPEELAKHEQMLAEEKVLAELYEEKGWTPVATLDALDEPLHMELRRLFDKAFRPGRIKQLDPFVEDLTNKLFDAFVDKGECEWVAAVAIPLPLYVIGEQMGVPEEDMPQIKAWTDAWVQRLGLMQTFEERLWSAEQEIEAQQYFQPIFDRLRVTPEDTLLSDLVNNEIPEWDRPLTNNELHSEMMADLFVGGSETTTNALSAGMMMLIQQPDIWAALKSDPEKYLPTFIEEVVRLESPVQGLLRELSQDVEMHGVHMPAGSIVNLRFASANRDGSEYDRVTELDLERERPKSHLGYGFGSHFCLGAPLARRELYWGFKILTERVENMRFAEGKNDFKYQPNYFLRALLELHIEFDVR